MKNKVLLGVGIVLCCLGVARAADVIMRAGFEDENPDNFKTESIRGGLLAVAADVYSCGRFSLKCKGDNGVDVERYIKFTDNDTKVGFHYKADGMRTIRVLGGSLEAKENLYFDLTNVNQRVWQWAVVKVAAWRNVIRGTNCQYGDRYGKGNTFKNIVFHLVDVDKKIEEPVVYLDDIVIYSGPDEVPPQLKGKPALKKDSQGRFLGWADAEDNVGVAYYRIFKGDTEQFPIAGLKPVAESVTPDYTPASQAAWYRVVAVDYDGNSSVPSAPIWVETASAGETKHGEK